MRLIPYGLLGMYRSARENVPAAGGCWLAFRTSKLQCSSKAHQRAPTPLLAHARRFGAGRVSVSAPARTVGVRGLARGREWTQAQIAAAERGVVAVLYASAYGNTAALAQAISRGVTKAGACRAPRTWAAASSAA